MAKDPLRERLDAQKWGDIYPRLVDFATHRSGSKARGEDLAHQAIARVYAYDSKWDPEKEPKLLRYLMSVVNSVLANERKSAAERKNLSMEAHPKRLAKMKDERAPSADRIVDNDLYARRIALLQQMLAKDAEATLLLELTLVGHDTPADQVRETGWLEARVLAARKRMHRAAEMAARELPGDEPAAGAQEDDDDEGEEPK
jgi:DNA-directed RNA polymerase specialized sigma24 family protein